MCIIITFKTINTIIIIHNIISMTKLTSTDLRSAMTPTGQKQQIIEKIESTR